jgi:hypothetical protein
MKNNFANILWILDGGASCHYFRFVEGLTDIKEINELIKIGNGDLIKAKKSEIRNVRLLRSMEKSLQ